LTDCLERIVASLKQRNRVPRRIYALGLGYITESRSAQIQVAFLLRLVSTMGTSPELVAFDPIQTAQDEAILRSLGIRPLSREEAVPPSQGGHSDSTLLYMPHCPRPLYERYLRANWAPSTLSNLTLCCNRLDRYTEFLSDEQLSKESPCLWRCLPYLAKIGVPSLPAPNGEALNDLAFQWVQEGQQTKESAVEEPEDEQAMTRVGPSKRTQRRRANKRHGTVPVERPVMDDDGFWTLPPVVQSEADREVL
jgi:hypothetical protein